MSRQEFRPILVALVVMLGAMLVLTLVSATAVAQTWDPGCPYSWDTQGGYYRVFCGSQGLWAVYPDGTWYQLAPYSSPEVGSYDE